MARFSLGGANTPNYGAYMPPQLGKEERPIEQIEKFATFLNEVPFFPKGEDEEETDPNDGVFHFVGNDETPAIDPNYVPVEATDNARTPDETFGPEDLAEGIEVVPMDFANALEEARAKRIAENKLGQRETPDDGKYRYRGAVNPPAGDNPTWERQMQKDEEKKMEGYKPLNRR